MSLELAYFYGSEAEQYSFYRIPKVLITDRRYKSFAAQVGNDLLIHGTAARSSDDVRNNKADRAKGHSQCRLYVNRKSRKP